jgi:hypothetical protein
MFVHSVVNAIAQMIPSLVELAQIQTPTKKVLWITSAQLDTLKKSLQCQVVIARAIPFAWIVAATRSALLQQWRIKQVVVPVRRVQKSSQVLHAQRNARRDIRPP